MAGLASHRHVLAYLHLPRLRAPAAWLLVAVVLLGAGALAWSTGPRIAPETTGISTASAAGGTDAVGALARWSDARGRERLLVASADGAAVMAYATSSGRPLARHALETGARIGDLRVVGDVLFVADRAQRRIDVLQLPAMRPLARLALTQGSGGLRVRRLRADAYRIQVTDYRRRAGAAPGLALRCCRRQRLGGR